MRGKNSALAETNKTTKIKYEQKESRIEISYNVKVKCVAFCVTF